MAGEGRADHDVVHAAVLEQLRLLDADERVLGQEHLLGLGIEHRVEEDAAEGALVDRGDDLAALHHVGELDAVHGVAVVLGDDHVLHDVDQTAGEVARVGRLQGGVGEALAGAVGGGEVLEHREAFAEGRGDGRFDDFAVGLGHEAAHAGELAHLVGVAAGARVGHHVHGVEAHVLHLLAGGGIGAVLAADLLVHLGRDGLGRLGPDVDDLVVLLGLGDDAFAVLVLDFVHVVLALVENLLLAAGDEHVLEADGDAGARGVLVAHVLDLVAENDRGLGAAGLVGGVDELRDGLLGEHVVHGLEGQLRRQDAAHEHAAGRGVVDLAVGHAHLDHGLQADDALVVGALHFPGGAERHAFAGLEAAGARHVVEAEHHVL